MNKGNTTAIIAHVTIIGWIIAVIMNNAEKNDFASFYIRQTLGIMGGILVGSVLGSIIAVLGWVIHVAALILWILSLINAIQAKKELTPFVGDKFQEWFKSL